MIRRKRKNYDALTEFLNHRFSVGLHSPAALDDLQLLVELVQAMRPENVESSPTFDILPLLDFLKANPEKTAIFSKYLKSLIKGKGFSRFLSDAAILQDVDFISELRKRISFKFLPHQPQKDQLEFLLNQVFFRESDQDWIDKIPFWQIEELVSLLQMGHIYETVDPDSPLVQLTSAMNLIIQRVSGRAMESDVLKMVPEFDNMESPFTGFEKELLQIEERLRITDVHYVRTTDLAYRQMGVMLHQCKDFVDRAFANSSKYGISIRVNQHLLRIRQQLERLETLMPILAVDEISDRRKNTIRLALELIRYNSHKNNIRKFIAEGTRLVSYEITQHTAKTGEHYITGSAKDYFKMFRSALAGGFIVGFLCLFKLLLSKVDASIFGHAFFYSMNYSLGFMLIYLTGATLATKQPAMTASVLARTIDTDSHNSSSDRYSDFAVLFARVFRSQFIAFAGNVLMAFPVSLGLIYGLHQLFGYNAASSKWMPLLVDLSPIDSKLVFHAAIAGVFLFLSGIITGMIANRDRHNQVYYRIQEHPILKKSLGIKRTTQISRWYEKYWAGLVSNFWFGVFMGSVAPIGIFLGLDLDIRHITFASGNLALALYGSGFQASQYFITWALIGIPLIGLVNFLVSFTLSASLALRSRNISVFELRFVGIAIFSHFKKHPMSFFFPVERKVPLSISESQ